MATKAGLKEAEREAEKTLGEAQEGLKEAWRELDEELDRVVELEGEVEKEKEKLAERKFLFSPPLGPLTLEPFFSDLHIRDPFFWGGNLQFPTTM